VLHCGLTLEGDTVKQCFRCKEKKPLFEFYAHPRMRDGRLGKCISCTKQDMKNLRTGPSRDRILAYDRARGSLPQRVSAREEYAQTERGRERQAAGVKAWAERNPEKKRAHTAVGNAIRDGKLFRPSSCEKCGAKCKPHGHHDDYSNLLDVRWLCVRCHADLHWR